MGSSRGKGTGAAAGDTATAAASGTATAAASGTAAGADGAALAAAVRSVLARLDAHAARFGNNERDVSGNGDEAGEGPAGPPAALPTLDALTSCFGLSPFEREIVLLAAASELDPTTGARCA